MRRSSVLLLVLGAILLTLSGVARFVIYPDIHQLPSNWDRTAVYNGTGSFLNVAAIQQGDAAHALVANAPVDVQRHVRVAQTSGSTAVVTDNISVTSSGQPVSDTCHVWSMDRTSLDGVPAPSSGSFDCNGRPMTVSPHQGVTIGFPIDVGPRDYTYWDMNTQTTVPAHYVDTEQRAGRTAYVFTVSASGPVTDQQVLAVLPQALPKSLLVPLAPLLPPAVQARLSLLAAGTASPLVPLTYTSTNTVKAWIDSNTGLPLYIEQQQAVTANATGNRVTVPLIPVLSTDITQTAASTHQAVTDAQNADTAVLWLGVIAPLVLLVLGVLVVALAVWLQLRRRGPRPTPPPVEPDATP